ncbi:BTB-domain-containing protein [Gigaspora margarita]|uniref:BTB-domain-containing protein n=1 Tax=Gigaspora margarita TaxID=4874 RepID=A0A8H4A0H9_GIGMA|nr:BTB-domain-containing protein [Gigaspora margarita]
MLCYGMKYPVSVTYVQKNNNFTFHFLFFIANMSNESIQNLLKNSKHSDIDTIIKVGGEPNIKEFKAHSIILSAGSPYFKTALSSRWARKENGIIIFNKPNIFPPVFETLINYIYTKTFSNKSEVSFLEIFIAADEIELYELSEHVKKCLLETKSAWKFPKDFITIWQIFQSIETFQENSQKWPV